MSASNDFKEQLKKQDLNASGIRNALSIALSEAIELKITTWVVTPDSSSSGPEQAKPGSRMQTRINIVDGDIQNEIGSEFLSSGPYNELQPFHLSQVEEGREIIKENLESLQQLFKVLVGTLQQLSPTPSPRLDAPNPLILPETRS